LHLDRDISWLDQAQGQAIKVLAPLLAALPPRFRYNIIWMDRDLSEVAASQQAMLARQGKAQPDALPLQLPALLEQQRDQNLRLLERQANMRFIRIQYTDLLRQPAQVAAALETFLQRPVTAADISRCTHEHLYRNRR
jgi:hypothetical protein